VEVKPVNIRHFDVDGWDAAAAAAVECLPELSGSVDSRWLQLQARKLLQAAIWHVKTTSTAAGDPVDASVVLAVLESQPERLDVLLDSDDPRVAQLAQQVSRGGLAWMTGKSPIEVVADVAVREMVKLMNR
jgi:hypothetical protein